MKVLQVLLSDRLGGAEALGQSLQEEWQRLGVVCNTVYLDTSKTGRLRRVKRLLGLRKSIREVKPTVIIAHSALPIAYCRLVRPRAVPLVDVLHSSGSDFSNVIFRLFETLTNRQSAHVIAVSEVAARVYRQQIRPRAEIEIIENGVRPLRSGPRMDSSATRVVTLARVAEEKRPEFWASVAAKFKNRDVLFEWYGPYEGSAGLEALVVEHETLGRPGRFRGPTGSPGLVLSNADILFHPSNRESQGVAIIEAVLAGVPVVCSEDVAAGLEEGLVARTFEEGLESDGGAASAIQDLISCLDEEMLLSSKRAKAAAARYGMTQCAEAYLSAFQALPLRAPRI